MRLLHFIVTAMLFFSISVNAQQCSVGIYQLFQDDKSVSSPCEISLLLGNIVNVNETQGYNLSCKTTNGNSNPDSVYFTNSVTLSATGQRFCGSLLDPPVSCDPIFMMSATQAASASDFNRFTFTATDRTAVTSCSIGRTQTIFRQCAGQPCNSDTGGNGCDPTPTTDFSANQDTPTNCDPILLDLKGGGIDLTNTAQGVRFDIHANGRPIQIPWTSEGSDTAFLVLDRNGNGKIDDATELFSNASPQPLSSGPNGFKALAQYDLPQNGGNGDGVIDSSDAVFPRLRLWIDANHDGISQPEELRTLPAMSVFSISLDFQRTHKQDQFGNIFLLQAKVNSQEKSDVGRKAYDVFFVTH